jgi:hypothetical protein
MQQRLGKSGRNTRALSRGIIALCALAATGCSHYRAYISSVADPAFSPQRTDPLFLTLPTDANIQERKLRSVLRNVLCHDGFTVVDTPEKAIWLLGLSYERSTRSFGSETQAIVVPLSIPVASSRTHEDVGAESKAYLYLIQAQTSKGRSAWEGSISTRAEVFHEYQPMIFHPLLERFGKDVEGSTTLSKSYLYSLRPCG